MAPIAAAVPTTGGMTFVAILAAILAAAAGAGLTWWLASRRGTGFVARARAEAEALVADARARAAEESRASVSQLDEELAARRDQWEKEEQDRQKTLRDSEEENERRHRRLVDRDRALARRDQLLNEREADLERRREELDAARGEVARLEEAAMLRLEEVAALSREEAKRQLVDALRTEARQSAAAEVRAIKEEVQVNADREAQKIMALAIERLASDFSAERSVSTVTLPEGAMRGRIIGVEGRNIRAFEKITGMQLVLDEDPGTVVVSGFNPVRREIARRALEKLVEGGTIHPRKIQQVVAITRRKVEQEMIQAGQEAISEFRFDGVHPEIAALLGRLKYRTSYGQNVLEHVKEAAHICGMMAVELGLDQRLAQRAALLHDIGKAVDFEREGTHPEIGGELARRYGEPPVVVNAIESHHDDCEVIHPISVLVAAADALSGARPGARRRTTVDYIRRVTRLEELAHSFKGVETCYALQAGREIRVIVESGTVSDDATALLAHDLSQRIQSEMDYPGRIKVTVIREVRAQAVAH